MGYSQCSTDHCMFVKHTTDARITILAVFVDDVLIASNEQKDVQDLRSMFRTKYQTENFSCMSDTKYLDYIGVRISPHLSGIGWNISAVGTIDSILKQYNVDSECVTPATLDSFNFSNSDTGNNTKELDKKYLSKLMKLFYIANKYRYDILQSVSYMSLRSHKTTLKDYKNIDRCLSYLVHSREDCLLLKPTHHLQIVGWCDSSYNIHADSTSHSGIIVSISETDDKKPASIVYCSSAKQKAVSRSSFEAEAISLQSTLYNCIIIWNLLQELNIANHFASTIKIYNDNLSLISMVKEPNNGTKTTRHILNRINYINKYIQDGKLEVVYMPTEELVADVLTKSLVGSTFRKFKSELLGLERN